MTECARPDGWVQSLTFTGVVVIWSKVVDVKALSRLHTTENHVTHIQVPVAVRDRSVYISADDIILSPEHSCLQAPTVDTQMIQDT